jgi:hypothetical protein
MYTIDVEPEIFPEGIWFNGFHQETRILKRDSRGYLEGTKENPLQVDDDYLPIVREEFRRWTQEQLDWIFKGIPFGATSPLPEDDLHGHLRSVTVNNSVVDRLQDKTQPKRDAKGKKPGFHINFYNNISFEDKTNDLWCRLQPSHGGVEAQRLLCDRVEFESYNLKERLNGIR